MKRVKFGIVGTNFISDLMIAGARLDERFEAAAIYSRAEDTGRAFAAKHGIARVYTSFNEMIDSADIDAVYIASPNYIHAAQSIVAMNRGKHVLCEKPMASNAAEVQAMIQAAHANNVLLMEAMIPTLSPGFRLVMDNLHRVGQVRRYFASYCQYSSRYDAFKQGRIANAFKPELSNGAVMDIGVYCLYPMVALFGEPNSLTATALKLHTGVDGQGTVVAQYDGFDAVAIYSKIADSKLPTEIQGEEGTLTIDRINNPKQVIFTPHDKTLPAEVLNVVNEPDNEYYYEMKEFIDLLEAGELQSKFNTHQNSLTTVRLIDQIRQNSGIIFPADNTKPCQ